MDKLRGNRSIEEKEKENVENAKRNKTVRNKKSIENPLQYRNSVAICKAQYRQHKTSTSQGRRRMFLDSVKHGPIYSCVCCHRSCFENGVVSLKANFREELEVVHPGLFSKAIGKFIHVRKVSGKYNLCFTCKKYLLK